MDLHLGLGSGAETAIAIVSGVLTLLLMGLLLRSACDLAGLDPSPHYVRCLIVSLILTLLSGSAAYGVFTAIGGLNLGDPAAVAANVLVDVPVFAAVGTVICLIAFRLRFGRAFLIWLLYTLLDLLVGAVIFLLLMGGATTVGAARRLF
jgi:hypothetical protein